MPISDEPMPDDDGRPANAAPSAAPSPTPSYAQNRETLRIIAERLRIETDIDIDELIPLIDQATAAYRACRERIETVERLIQERLPSSIDGAAE